jgi:hypothetical protein
VKLWFPSNDRILFVFSAISMRDYDWSRKRLGEKIAICLLIALYLIAFGYVCFAVAAHRPATRADLTWAVFWAGLKSFGILALFPIIILPVIFAVRAQFLVEPEHTFFAEWARVFTGYGKRQHICFFAENLEHVKIESALLDDELFYLITLDFKPWKSFVGRKGRERFGIRAEDKTVLRPLQKWLQENQVRMTWESAKEI